MTEATVPNLHFRRELLREQEQKKFALSIFVRFDSTTSGQFEVWKRLGSFHKDSPIYHKCNIATRFFGTPSAKPVCLALVEALSLLFKRNQILQIRVFQTLAII